MKTALGYLLLSLAGVAVGAVGALWLSGLVGTGSPAQFNKLQVNGWGSDPSIGTTAASPYMRARVARHGLLALAKEEAIYFTRSRDNHGEPLRESCQYELAGGAQDAYWWSVTLYDADSRLPMNDDAAMSIDATKTAATANRWTAVIASERPRKAAHWLSSRAAGQFDLTLRLYRPSGDVLSQPTVRVNTPTITRLACAEQGR